MKLSLKAHDLSGYVASQLNHFFPDNNPVLNKKLDKHTNLALERTAFCFKHISKKYFYSDGLIIFNHLNSDQYAMFLYLLSHTIFKETNDSELSTKVFLLNKLLHSLDIFYEVNLPDIFLFVHPIGSVIGRASYQDRLVIYQNCTIGGNFNNEASVDYPSFAGNNILFSNVSVIGNCTIGHNVLFGAHTLCIGKNIPDNSVVTGTPSSLTINQNKTSTLDMFFHA